MASLAATNPDFTLRLIGPDNDRITADRAALGQSTEDLSQNPGFHYKDPATGRSVIVLNPASPDSMRPILAHEMSHQAQDSGLADSVVKELIGDPDLGVPGLYSKLDAFGNPVLNPDRSFATTDDFAQAKQTYIDRLKTFGVDASGLTDREMALEHGAEIGADFLLSKKFDDALRPTIGGLMSSLFPEALRNAVGSAGTALEADGSVKGSMSLGLKTSPGVESLIENYMKDWRVSRNATSSDEDKPAVAIQRDQILAQPDVLKVFQGTSTLNHAPDGTIAGTKVDPATGKLVITDESKVFKSAAQAAKDQAELAEHVVEAVRNAKDTGTADGSVKITNEDGKEQAKGRFLSDDTIAQLEKGGKLNAYQLDIVRNLNALTKAANGNYARFFYQPALKNGRYASLRGHWREEVPTSWLISKQDNILFQTFSPAKVFSNPDRLWSKADSPARSIWFSRMSMDKDALTYLKNLGAGLSGETGLDTQRKNFLNLALGISTKERAQVNPFYDGDVHKKLESVITARRIDRTSRLMAPDNTSTTPWSREAYQRGKMNQTAGQARAFLESDDGEARNPAVSAGTDTAEGMDQPDASADPRNPAIPAVPDAQAPGQSAAPGPNSPASPEAETAGDKAPGSPENGLADTQKLFRGTTSDNLDGVRWFSDSKQVARDYAAYGESVSGKKGQVLSATAALKNPLIIDAKGKTFGELRYDGNRTDPEELVALAKAQGHDGLILRNVVDHADLEVATDYEPHTSVAVFDRSQINLTGSPGVSDRPPQPMSPGEIEDQAQRISTRVPTAKKATEDAIASQLAIGTEHVVPDKETATEVAKILRRYPNVAARGKAADVLDDFKNHVVDNLLWLHDQMPPETRERARLWYDGARKLAEDYSTKYGITRQQAAGVLASLSPQKDWYMNVDLARRVIETHAHLQDRMLTPEMAEWFRNKFADKNPAIAQMLDGSVGTKYQDLSLNHKAIAVRAHDELNNARNYPLVNPEGTFGGDVTKVDGGSAKVGWGDFTTIGKALSILEDGSRGNISARLGQEHKVRNFYNNILLPRNPEHGDVTIDTHAVAAGLLRPLAGSDEPVSHNFGSGAPGSAVTGASGLYGIYADAYREAAKQRGILPREMQSITWEAVRGLFSPEFKTAKNKAAVDAVWKEYKDGNLTLDDARNQILTLAGGKVAAPSWAVSDS